jgi:hypothetical protein
LAFKKKKKIRFSGNGDLWENFSFIKPEIETEVKCFQKEEQESGRKEGLGRNHKDWLF